MPIGQASSGTAGSSAHKDCNDLVLQAKLMVSATAHRQDGSALTLLSGVFGVFVTPTCTIHGSPAYMLVFRSEDVDPQGAVQQKSG